MPIGRQPIEKGSVISNIDGSAEKKNSNRKKENGNTKKYEAVLIDPSFTFKDVVLSDELWDLIQDAISIFQYKDLLFKEWNISKVIKNKEKAFINLYGAPGTGKTMVANAIANELGMKIILVNYADIESKFVGETSKNIVSLFEEAGNMNALLLFDEADALLSRRVTDMSSATDVSVNQTRSVLLHMLDEYEGIVVFTTNFIQNYDPAFMRRITYHIKFELPNENMRNRILHHYLDNTVPHSIDVEYLAKEYEGITGNDVANALMISAVKTARNHLKQLPQEYYEDALRRILKSRNDNKRIYENVRVYEREVTEEYAKSQLEKGGKQL